MDVEWPFCPERSQDSAQADPRRTSEAPSSRGPVSWRNTATRNATGNIVGMVPSLLPAKLCLQGRGVNRCEGSPGHLRRCRLIVSHATEWITRRWSGHHGDHHEDDERGEDHQELPVEAVGVCEVPSVGLDLIVVSFRIGHRNVFSVSTVSREDPRHWGNGAKIVEWLVCLRSLGSLPCATTMPNSSAFLTPHCGRVSSTARASSWKRSDRGSTRSCSRRATSSASTTPCSRLPWPAGPVGSDSCWPSGQASSGPPSWRARSRRSTRSPTAGST